MDEGWLDKIAGVLNGVRTPLSLGGLSVIVLCIIYNRILSLDIFAKLNDSQTVRLLSDLVGYVFWLALVAVALGIAGYLIRPNSRGGRTGGRS
ncbi:MAG: hypothetical protein ABSC22_10805 [Roseiarcus sp.]|jgi:hypothetical protein